MSTKALEALLLPRPQLTQDVERRKLAEDELVGNAKARKADMRRLDELLETIVNIISYVESLNFFSASCPGDRFSILESVTGNGDC